MWHRLIMMSNLLKALMVLALSGTTLAFLPTNEKEVGVITHGNITRMAILQKVTEVCRKWLEAAGHEFKLTGPSPEELVQACLEPTASGQVSGAKFRDALEEICTKHGLVDRDFASRDAYHFNSEEFLQGRSLITQGMAAINANIKIENFPAAREKLGEILHTLQDFYSHSNWVELGNTEPFENLIKPQMPLENLADPYTATCNDCTSGTCPNPILQIILKEKKLTSGYTLAKKRKGKCSHGDESDQSSTAVSRGINKDRRNKDNMVFHDAAVKAATDASVLLLQEICSAVGDLAFLRLMGIARSSVVCFVIDTTGSMSDDIDEAREVVYDIIDTNKGTQDEPSEYILVPFNDPDFGPMIRTPDPNKMKQEISKLKAKGGGDTPEMCLSGLQLALTGAPRYSQIFVFTDAPAKDIVLKDTIIALTESTKSTVSFFLTAAFRRRRRSISSSFNDYKDMALASGGQAIQVAKNQLPQATEVILDTSTSALVTVLQRARNPGKPEIFTFLLDESLKNVTIYITGTYITFTLTNPTGVSQKDSEAIGTLGTIQTVGNLRRIRLNTNKQTGTWQINIGTNQPYTLKVTGQSTITFIYNFVERFEGAHPGYAVITGRPQAGRPAILIVSVMGRKGPSSLDIGEVGLVDVSGPEAVQSSTITKIGDGDILVTVDAVPEGEFVVALKGTDKVSSSEFQRQSTTQMAISKVHIQAVVDRSVEPGEEFSLPFSVMTQGPGGQFSISARNDRDFSMLHPSSLTLETGIYFNASLTITPPVNTPSGTDVTLTLDAKSASGAESNYAVLRLSVVTKITDFVPPVCAVGSVLADDCPRDASKCKTLQWGLTANITDGNGTGIERVSLYRGNGTLSLSSLPAPTIYLNYNASCCSPIFEIITVDKVGNVGRCYYSVATSGGPGASTSSLPLVLCFLVSAFAVGPFSVKVILL